MIGGGSGAVLLLAISVLLSKVMLFVMIGTGCGEVFGCWLALRRGRYEAAGLTATVLALLTIPGSIFFYMMSFLTGGVVAAILTIIGLPLLARVLTSSPNYPRDPGEPEVSRNPLHTYAKMSRNGGGCGGF